MKRKVKIYVNSFKAVVSQVDIDKICTHCGPTHREKTIAQQLAHSPDYSCLLPEGQTRIVDTTVEICEKHNLEYELVDIENLSFLSKMKLFFKGIRAPAVAFEGKIIKGTPSGEDFKV